MKTHDYTQQTWGHSVAILRVLRSGQKIDLSGFGLGVEPGDFLILGNGKDSTRYQVETIRYANDPGDQWFALAAFAPRSIPAEKSPKRAKA